MAYATRSINTSALRGGKAGTSLDSGERCTGRSPRRTPGIVAPSEYMLEPGLVVALRVVLARERAAVFGGRARFTSIGLFAEI